MQDFFPSMTLKPNPACEEKMCQQRQREYQVTLSQEGMHACMQSSSHIWTACILGIFMHCLTGNACMACNARLTCMKQLRVSCVKHRKLHACEFRLVWYCFSRTTGSHAKPNHAAWPLLITDYINERTNLKRYIHNRMKKTSPEK